MILCYASMYSLAKGGVSNVTSLFRDVTIELYAHFQSLLPPLLSMLKPLTADGMQQLLQGK